MLNKKINKTENAVAYHALAYARRKCRKFYVVLFNVPKKNSKETLLLLL